MVLSRALIVNTAMTILREYGLADLSMRRLARDLDVQPGALYWHFKNKQDLLTVLAGVILEAVGEPTSLRALLLDIRGALLSVNDGAEVVALAHALVGNADSPLQQIPQALARQGASRQKNQWAADALIHHLLGSVMQEQSRAGLVRAGLLPDADEDTAAAFAYGLDLLLAGLTMGPR